MGKLKTYYLETYGCQMNFSDSELVASLLSRAGLEVEKDVYYNFRLPVVGTLSPRGSVRIAQALAFLGRSGMTAWIAGGFIVAARRPIVSSGTGRSQIGRRTGAAGRREGGTRFDAVSVSRGTGDGR